MFSQEQLKKMEEQNQKDIKTAKEIVAKALDGNLDSLEGKFYKILNDSNDTGNFKQAKAMLGSDVKKWTFNDRQTFKQDLETVIDPSKEGNWVMQVPLVKDRDTIVFRVSKDEIRKEQSLANKKESSTNKIIQQIPVPKKEDKPENTNPQSVKPSGPPMVNAERQKELETQSKESTLTPEKFEEGFHRKRHGRT